MTVFGYFRARPLLSAMLFSGAIFSAVFAALAGYLLANEKPFTPRVVLASALSMHRTSSDFNLFGERRRDVSSHLRGVTAPEAEQMLASCKTADKWTYVGDEESLYFDCSKIALMSCDAAQGKLIARLWMEWEKVDHIADLALGSQFLACRTEDCPDFALGEPSSDGVGSCGARFKVNGRKTYQ